MQKRYIFTTLFLALAVAGLLFFKKAKRPAVVSQPFSRTYNTQPLQPAAAFGQIQEPFRICKAGHNCIILTAGDSYYVIDRDLHAGNPVKYPDGSKGSIYTLYTNHDTLAWMNVDKRKLVLKTRQGNTSDYTLPDSLIISQAIFNPENSTFYFNIIRRQTSNKVFQVGAWNVTNGEVKTIIDNTVLPDSIMHYDGDCFSMVTDGYPFLLPGSRTGFLFTQGGYFAVAGNTDARLHQTLDKTAFKKYEKKPFNEAGMKGFMCEAAQNGNLNYKALHYGGKLYILSGRVHEKDGAYGFVDIYDAATFGYIETLRIPCSSMADYIYDFAITGNHLLAVHAKSGLKAYQKPKHLL